MKMIYKDTLSIKTGMGMATASKNDVEVFDCIFFVFMVIILLKEHIQYPVQRLCEKIINKYATDIIQQKNEKEAKTKGKRCIFQQMQRNIVYRV